MSTRSVSCYEIDLSVLLDGAEDSDLFRRVENHVDSCPDCQQRLTELTADANHWAIQREMLRPLAGDVRESGLVSRYHSPITLLGRQCAVDESVVKELLAAPSHPEMLGRLGRYEIERIIGTGGMGIVLKGFDSELNRPVAIKLLAPHLARVGAARQRFAREARAAAAVVHEHVVPIHNVESEDANPFLVMQFVPGESLQARVERDGPLSVAEILRIGMQAASGLAAAHAQGLVHRDVKPANILLENGVERVFLTDFGLARASDDGSLTYTGVVAGTPHYMSPEQADGQSLDFRSDLFSLGSVLYFMATGHPPFRAERPMAVLKRTCHDSHRPVWQCNPEIPDSLSKIIDRLLEKKPGSRFESAADLEKALAGVLADVQQGRVRRRKGVWLRPHYWIPVLSLATVSIIGICSALLIRPTSNEGPSHSTVPPSHLQAADDTEEELRSAVYELEAVDPSPTAAARAELDSLFEMLNELQGTPFPEAQLGTSSPKQLESDTAPNDDSPPPDENRSEATNQATAWPVNFRSAPWKEVLDWYCAIAGRALHADEFPDGTFNYAGAKPHSFEEITSILQPVLRTKGMLLRRQQNAIQLIRLSGTQNGNILGIRLPTHDELAERRQNLLDLKGRIAELNKQRSAIPTDATDREKQLAVIQAKTDSLSAEHQTALKVLEVESQEAKVAIADAQKLSAGVDAVNAQSANCVPQHTQLRLQRELLGAKATLDEINAILDIAHIVTVEPQRRK